MAMEEYILIGVEELDRQHQEFFRHIDALRDALREGSGNREVVLRTIEYLEEFITVHFRTEERYMRLHYYTGILKHESEHAVFARDVAALKRRVLSEEAQQGMGMPLLAIEIEHRLEGWLRDHIGTTDKKLGEYLSGRV